MYPTQGGQGAGPGAPWPNQPSPAQHPGEAPPSQQHHQQHQQPPPPPHQSPAGAPSWAPTSSHSQYPSVAPQPQSTPLSQPPSRGGNSIPPPQSAPPPPQQQQQQQQQPPPPPGQPIPTLHPGPEYRSLPPVMPYQPPYQMGYPPSQPAPRQRTAIACRYCRRRKIRCSGFDQSEDGRCTNCQRFSQECVFTPVSAQTQAFVPAHTVWRGQNAPPNMQLYGAYGQPLPQHGNRDGYAQQPQQPGQYPPPPQGYQQQAMYPQEAGRKRGNDEPHTPTLPPPNPAQMQYGDPSGAKEDGSTGGKEDRNYKDIGVQVDILK